MKLWDKGYNLDKIVEKYTVGIDYILDKRLFYFDCIASIAHAKMLNKVRILTDDETNKIIGVLKKLIELDKKGEIEIKPEDEDCHTVIEKFLVDECGEIGKKIHTGRSRNDQVLVALRLYQKQELILIFEKIKKIIAKFEEKGKKFHSIEFAGYTHTRKAMPMSAEIWLGAFKDAFIDNRELVKNVLQLIDKSPLGTAAGFGVPVIDIDRNFTAKELGFSEILKNPVYAQNSRGKYDSIIIDVLSYIMFDLNKFATDMILFSSEEFGYIVLEDKITTGSSIMPQKKNPDLFEILRGNYHIVLGESIKVKSLIGNLISGYHRDIQLIKEPLIKVFDITKDSLDITFHSLDNFYFDEKRCKQSLTHDIYATHRAYKLVKDYNIPFREAYKKIAEDLKFS